MFTGIVEEIGIVKSIKRGTRSAVLNIQANKVLEDMRMGDSINTNGICLTVTGFDSKGFTVDVMFETIKRTNLNDLLPGSKVNLERALQISDRLGGHLVSGHIDGTGSISNIQKDDNAILYTIECDVKIAKYIIEKGSVGIDGISLTVVNVNDKNFTVSIIPHTVEMTNLSEKNIREMVNIECDMIGKYVEKFLMASSPEKKENNIDLDFLTKHGFTE